MSSNPCNQVHGLRGEGLAWLIGAQYACWQHLRVQSPLRGLWTLLNLRRTRLLQPVPISHHFHDCKAPLAHASHVKWRYTKYLGFSFFFSFKLSQNQHGRTCKKLRLKTVHYECALCIYGNRTILIHFTLIPQSSQEYVTLWSVLAA